MKSIFKIMFFSFSVFIGMSIIPQQANSQINPCWKLVCPHDPANGFFNPDSVYVDTCQSSSTYQHEFAKGWFQYRVLNEHQIQLPEYPDDTTVIVSINNFPLTFAEGLIQLDSIFGHYIIKKKYPDCSDTNIFASFIYQFKFENYIDVNTYKDSINIRKNINWIDTRQLGLSNQAKINDINPNWKLPWGHDPLHGYVNPDSLMIDSRYYNHSIPFEHFDDEYYGKTVLPIFVVRSMVEYLNTNSDLANTHIGDTIHFDNLDSNIRRLRIRKSFEYFEKEFGHYTLIFTGKQDNTDSASGLWLHKLILDHNYPITFVKRLLNEFTGAQIDLSVKLFNYNEPNTVKEDLFKSTFKLNLALDHDNIIINYFLINSNDMRISLFNETGQIITKIFNGFQNSGQNQITYNIANLNHGLYFIILCDGTNTITKKFIK
jgi:hypothetical protein